MIKRILCYGDSNTWGYKSNSNHERLEKRWTKILKQKLGDEFEIIEEGLNSRTITSKDERIGKEGRVGSDYLLPCLDSHNPLDYVIVMLGTNELKIAYNKSAEEIGIMLTENIIKPILTRNYYNYKTPNILIICPAKINSQKSYDSYDKTSEEKSIVLEPIYKKIAHQFNCQYLSANDLETGEDGVHLTEKSHEILANRIFNLIKP